MEFTSSDKLLLEAENSSMLCWCRSKTSQISRNNSGAIHRTASTSTTAMPRLAVMAFTEPTPPLAWAAISVPFPAGLREFSTKTGMLLRIAGSKVEGCNTLAPK